MRIEDEDFFKSEVVKEELDDLQECYTELLQMSQGFQSFDTEARLNHINKTLDLIAKQKVFYSRLQLMAGYVQVNSEDDTEKSEIGEMKDRIDQMSSMYSGGGNLLSILQVMEDKLLGWKKDLQDGKSGHDFQI